MSGRGQLSTDEPVPLAPSNNYMILDDDDEAREINFTFVENGLHEMPFENDDDKIVLAASLEDEDDELASLLMVDGPTKINGLNLLNVATYIMHLFVSYGVGVWGLDGLVNTRVQVFHEHDTLITPATWAYYIWIPILVTETVFVIAQLFSEYRGRPIIQQGVSFFFFYTCLLQTGWTMFFCFEMFLWSFICVFLSVVALASLLASQHLVQIRGRRTRDEFWLFRFCFLLHFAWMVVMASVHFALLIRHSWSENYATQLASDIAAISVLLPVACYFLLQTDGYNFIIPAVILWSYIGMEWRLQHPGKTLHDDYGELIVSSVRQVLWFFIGVVTFLLGPRVLIWICNTYYTIRVIRLGDDSTADDHLSRSSYWNINS